MSLARGRGLAATAEQWRSQDLEVGGTGGLGNGSPPAGSRGRAPGGWFGRHSLLKAHSSSYGYLAAKPCTILCI